MRRIIMKKLTALILSISVVATVFTGCGSSNQSNGTDKKNTKKYVIATDAKYAPFEFEKDGKYIGIDVDLLAAISKIEGFDYELKPMDFNGIIPGIQANQLDAAIAGMTITDARKQVLDFSDGYFESGLSAVAKADNSKINTLNDFNGKIFAVKKGTEGAKYAEENKDKLNAQIRYFDDSPSMFQEVKNGNADVTFEDYPVVAYMIAQDKNSGLKLVGEKISKAYYGFAVKKGSNPELIQKFNDGLKKLKENGEYDKIVAKYIGK
jgi:glutamine transport system substrate-binding protein